MVHGFFKMNFVMIEAWQLLRRLGYRLKETDNFRTLFSMFRTKFPAALITYRLLGVFSLKSFYLQSINLSSYFMF